MPGFTKSFLLIQILKQFRYRVKIINPKSKKESIIIDWHGVTEKFETVSLLKSKLTSSLGVYLPPDNEFSVGYFHGRPQLKSWILSENDLHTLYQLGNTEILLWCDGKSEKSDKKRKRSSTEYDEDDEPVVPNKQVEQKRRTLKSMFKTTG